MATTQKRYLDLNGLTYLLSKLSYTKAAEKGKFLTGIAEKNGVISVTSASLTASDIPAIGTPETYSAATALTGSVATITNTITRDGGKADLTASFKLGVSGDLTLARDNQSGALTIGYAEKVKGVKTDGYLTLSTDDKLLDINSTKLANVNTAADAAGTLLTTKAYVDTQVSKAIAGGVQYKGTTATLPDNHANGDMWKLTAAIASIKGSKAGDVIIYHTSGTPGWDLIPSGDDVEYTGIKVGDTTVIGVTTGGDATFAAGEGLAVAGTAGTVTYSHAIPTGAAEKNSGFYKIATDKFGHVTGTVAVAKADITGLLGDYVSTIGGHKGDITLKGGSKNKGDINLSFSSPDKNELQAAIVGLGSAAFANTDAFAAAKHTHEITDVNGLEAALNGKQAAFIDGTATIASEANGVVTLKAGIKQTKGAIANSGTDITLAKIATTGKAEDVKLDAIVGVKSTDVQAAIAELHTAVTSAAAAGVQSIDDKTGAIKLDKTSAADGSVKFAWDTTDEKLLKATVTLPTANATIVTAENDLAQAAYKGAAATKVTIKTVVKETNGKIAAGADDVVMQTITSAEIDTLFAQA